MNRNPSLFNSDSAANTVIIVFCTAPSKAFAETIARGVIEKRLAACVNILSGVTSYYRWEGKINKDQELQLVIKSSMSSFNELADYIRSIHPYKVPEIVSITATGGSVEYLSWVLAESRSSNS